MLPEESGVGVLDTTAAGGLAIRGAALRFGVYAATAVLTLVSAPLLVRHLGVVDFGRYATVASLVALVGAITEAGLGPVGVREYASLEGRARADFMANLLGLRLTLSTVGVLGALLFTVVAGYGAELVAGTAAAGAVLLVAVAQQTYAVPLGTELRVGRLVAAELITNVLYVGLIAGLVLAGASLVPFLAAPVPTTILLLAVTAVLMGRRMPRRPGFALRTWAAVLRLTFPVALVAGLQALYFRCVILLMSLIAAPEETGRFATSFRITESLLAIPLLLLGSAFPVLVRAAHTDDRERLRYMVGRLVDVGLIGGAGLTAMTVLAAPAAVDLLTGDPGDPAADVLRVQALTLLIAFVAVGFGSVLLALRRHRTMFAAAAVAFVTTAATAAVLTPQEGRLGGALGGAVAAVAGETALLVALAVSLRRAAPEIVPRPTVLLGVLLATGAGLAAALLTGLPALAAAALFAVVYVAVLAVTGSVPAELRVALAERMRR